MSDSRDKELARNLAAVVFAVRSGQITAEEGARRLGVSRKTYYDWERRALQAMTEALENRTPGRPNTPKDEEKQHLQEEIAELRNKLFVAEKTVEVRDMLHAYELKSAGEEKRRRVRGKKTKTKEEAIARMLALIDQIKEKTGMPYRAICGAVRLPYPNFIRWSMRRKKDTPLVRQPGPPKVKPPDFGGLAQDIAQLSHGHDRTQGAGALYARHASSISRRELQSMVAMARHDQSAFHRRNLRRIRWNVPNVAWSMDPCEYKQRDAAGSKVHLNQMQDLASRYKFIPMTGDVPCGEEISGYLVATFDRFGAPLFLKRDNGGNLNHAAVNNVLADYFVVPVNSPVHYPPYNGAIEEAQTELKNGLAAKLAYRPCCPSDHLEAYASAVEHDLNHPALA